MAGLIHNEFKGFYTSNEINYYAIPVEKIEKKFSFEFREFLQSLKTNENEKSDHFWLYDSMEMETLLFKDFFFYLNEYY